MNSKAMLEAIKSRRSVFPNMYTDEVVTKASIELLLEASIWAPTHRKTQPWRYRVYHSEAARQQLADYLSDTYQARNTGESYKESKHKKIAKKPLQSGSVMAVIMQRDPMESIPEWEEIAAIGASVQNILLMADTLGLGAYWSSPSIITTGADDFLSLQKGQRCLGLIYVGHKKDLEFGSERKPIDQISTIL